jgi:hypothetical protein
MNTRFDSFVFLCRVLSPYTSRESVHRLREHIADGKVCWESVIAIANSHLLTAALWVGLNQKEMQSIVEPDTQNYIKHIHTMNRNRNNGLRRQLLEAIEILNSQGIHPLIIKGGSQLIYPIHGDEGARIMTDIDMCIPEDRLQEAVDALTAIGYSDGGKVLNNYHHWAPLFREGEYGAIELHTDVLPRSLTSVLNAADIYDQSETRHMQGLCFQTPNPTHAILLGLLHSQVVDSFFDEWAMGLKSLHDMVAIVARYHGSVDWKEINTRVARRQMEPIFKSYLWSAQRLFKQPLPFIYKPSLNAIMHHAFCMAAVQWRTVDRLSMKIVRYSKTVRRRFGGFQGLFRYAFSQVGSLII